MTRRFTCRGFEGEILETFTLDGRRLWRARIVVAGVEFRAVGRSERTAKSRVRRKLDAVERAFRERGFR